MCMICYNNVTCGDTNSMCCLTPCGIDLAHNFSVDTVICYLSLHDTSSRIRGQAVSFTMSHCVVVDVYSHTHMSPCYGSEALQNGMSLVYRVIHWTPFTFIIAIDNTKMS